jgi:hypothetical protein
MLTRLAYVSRALIPVHDAQMLEIARQSLRNNGRLGITGALYFDGSQFFQVLEGSDPALAVVFDAIRKDPRHCDVQVVCHGPIEQRLFSDWSMKFVDGQTHRDLANAFRYEQVVQHGCDAQHSRIEALAAA